MIGRLLDRAIAELAPVWALRRASARHGLASLRSYDGGRLDRLRNPKSGKQEAGDTPNLGEVQRTRWRAFEAFRNNPYFRKAIKAACAHVVGPQGLLPESRATLRRGEPFVDFRKATKRRWPRFCATADYHGKPGHGGQTFAQIQRLGFQELLLAGEFFVRFHRWSKRQMKERGLYSPLQVELISAERCVEDVAVKFSPKGTTPEGEIFRGIEFAADGRRLAYWFYKQHPQDPRILWAPTEMTRLGADEVLHVFIRERPDQQRGVPMVCAATDTARDAMTYQENTVVASTQASCIGVVVKTNPMGGGAGGLIPGTTGTGRDKDGNRITHVQPGMFSFLNVGEEIQAFNPSQPLGGAEMFINHLCRTLAAGIGFIKGSTVHCNYIGSSFSSEKSNDNDIWREVEAIQEFFAASLCQPVWEECLELEVNLGMLRVKGMGDWDDDKQYLAGADWNGPVALSINPTNDVQAATLRVANGTSSLQIESANIGTDVFENIDRTAEVYEYAISKGLPTQYANQLIGVKSEPVPDDEQLKLAKKQQSMDAEGQEHDHEMAESSQDLQQQQIDQQLEVAKVQAETQKQAAKSNGVAAKNGSAPRRF